MESIHINSSSQAAVDAYIEYHKYFSCLVHI